MAEAARVQDQQFRGIEELDDKSEQILKLGTLLLALGFAMGSTFGHVIVAKFAVSLWGAIPLALAFAANIVALFLLGHAYVSLSRRNHRAEATPSLEWLAQQAGDVMAGKLAAAKHYDSIIQGYAGSETINKAHMGRTSRHRKAGLLLLGVALCMYLVAGAYLGLLQFI